MFKDDKMVQGIIAGFIGAVVKDILTIAPELFKLRPTFWDYGEYLVFRTANKSMFAALIGIFVEILFGIFLAIIYNHIKHLIRTKHPLIRGTIFSILIWFIISGTIALYNVKTLLIAKPFTPIVNVAIAGIYGLIVAYILDRIEKSNNKRGAVN